MLLAHVFGDGNAVKIEGRETYFNYRQYDRTLTGLFIKKVEAVFGKLAYPHEYFFDLKRVYLPTIISLVIADYYGLSVADFLSDRARIPEQVFAVKSQMLAVLIAFIIDEGNVDSAQVAIRLKNPGLIIDLKRICGELGYACTVSKEDSEMPCLLILADGVKKLWADLSALKKEHPEVGMGHKEEAVKRFILRAKKEWRTASEGSAKNLIISILRDGPMRVRDLTRLVSMSRQGMRHHLTQLVSQGILQRKHLGGKKGYAYSLIRYVRLPVRRKGKSRQHGVTKQRVLSLLKERELTLKELNDVVCIDLNTLRNFLYRLEQDGLVERNGKRILTRRPWVVWKAR
jgi:predicted transcriptional regulator